MAQEYLPKGFSIGELKVEYKKSAVYGDMIYPYVARENEEVVVALCDGDRQPYAIIEMKKCNDRKEQETTV